MQIPREMLLIKFDDVIINVIKVTPSKDNNEANNIVDVDGETIFSILFSNCLVKRLLLCFIQIPPLPIRLIYRKYINVII